MSDDVERLRAMAADKRHFAGSSFHDAAERDKLLADAAAIDRAASALALLQAAESAAPLDVILTPLVGGGYMAHAETMVERMGATEVEARAAFRARLLATALGAPR